GSVVADHDLVVLPGPAGVGDVRAKARPAREPPTPYRIGLDERPRPVADDGNGLARTDERLDEGDRVVVHAQLVGIGDTTWQDQTVELSDVRLTRGDRGGERLCTLEMVEPLHLADARGDQCRGTAGALDSVPGFGQFDLLHA